MFLASRRTAGGGGRLGGYAPFPPECSAPCRGTGFRTQSTPNRRFIDHLAHYVPQFVERLASRLYFCKLGFQPPFPERIRADALSSPVLSTKRFRVVRENFFGGLRPPKTKPNVLFRAQERSLDLSTQAGKGSQPFDLCIAKFSSNIFVRQC